MNNYTPLAEEVLQLLIEMIDDIGPIKTRAEDLERLLKAAEKRANDLRNALKLNGGNNEKQE